MTAVFQVFGAGEGLDPGLDRAEPLANVEPQSKPGQLTVSGAQSMTIGIRGRLRFLYLWLGRL